MDSSVRVEPHRLIEGAWRWAAGAFAAMACAAGLLAIGAPASAGWAGFILLLGMAAVGSLFFFALWPRAAQATDAQRLSEAAARSHVAWAITNSQGAIVDCNQAYRRMAGVKAGEPAPQPELALTGEAPSAMLYRLARSAASRRTHEETVELSPGMEIAASVRPLKGGETAWWFCPMLARDYGLQDSRSAARSASAPATALDDAPIGVASVEADGRLADDNKAFAAFFGANGSLAGRPPPELVEPADRTRVQTLLD